MPLTLSSVIWAAVHLTLPVLVFLKKLINTPHTAHFRNRHLYEVIQPFALRAPEVILGYPWDTPVDIWSLGCLVRQLLHCLHSSTLTAIVDL